MQTIVLGWKHKCKDNFANHSVNLIVKGDN